MTWADFLGEFQDPKHGGTGSKKREASMFLGYGSGDIPPKYGQTYGTVAPF